MKRWEYFCEHLYGDFNPVEIKRKEVPWKSKMTCVYHKRARINGHRGYIKHTFFCKCHIESGYFWTQRARKWKKVQANQFVKSNESKNFCREIAFLAVWNFFLVQKLIFGHFWNCKKWNLVKKNFVKLIYLIARGFFWTFLKFLAHCVLSR